MRPSRSLMLSLLVLVPLACGPAGPRREYADVTGTIIYLGKPLEMGTVMFQPPFGAFAVGEIQPDGSYSLRGVVGENTVTITCRDPVAPAADSTDPTKPPERPKNHIPEIYGSLQAGLKFNVEPGANTADFELE